MSKQNHHYFASCALGWKTANTRDEAIRGLIDYFNSDFRTITENARKRGEIGTYVWTCKVLEPHDSKYEINFYQPQGVKIEEGMHHHTTYVTKSKVAYHTLAGSELGESNTNA